MMKIKSYITVILISSLCLSFILVVAADFLKIKVDRDFSMMIVTGFMGAVSSVLTFFFHKKSNESDEKTDGKSEPREMSEN